MRYYIIAGEASGDLHGSNLIKAIYRRDVQAEIRCWGGDKMREAGAVLVKHYRELAFMGFVEVVRHLGTILKNIRFCKEDVKAFRPDVLILIDYPGFNLRIADWAKKNGLKVCYYISPQLWAWKEGRIEQIRRNIDRMLVILPFEKKFYRKHGLEVDYIGHPLTQVVDEEIRKKHTALSDKPIIALLPGSRVQEIKKKLPVMLSVVKHFPQHVFIVAQAPGQEKSFYQSMIKDLPVDVVQGKTYELLKQSSAALVTSGTATLETALFGVPQVVCYKGNFFSYWLAKKLVKVRYISLVNLILNRPAVKELIQNDLTENNLFEELNKLLYDNEYKEAMQSDYTQLWEILGSLNASEEAAEKIIEMV